jgi:hypothetical protein
MLHLHCCWDVMHHQQQASMQSTAHLVFAQFCFECFLLLQQRLVLVLQLPCYHKPAHTQEQQQTLDMHTFQVKNPATQHEHRPDTLAAKPTQHGSGLHQVALLVIGLVMHCKADAVNSQTDSPTHHGIWSNDSGMPVCVDA